MAEGGNMRVAFYKGRTRVFNRLVSWWTRGPFSHCELVLGESETGTICWSSSFMDGGIRGAVIELDPDKWDVIALEVSDVQRAAIVSWFTSRRGAGYDVLGLAGFVLRPFTGERERWFCSEAVAAALGFPDPWRFDPNALACALNAQGGQWLQGLPYEGGIQ